jgi:hypothetical protein
LDGLSSDSSEFWRQEGKGGGGEGRRTNRRVRNGPPMQIENIKSENHYGLKARLYRLLGILKSTHVACFSCIPP